MVYRSNVPQATDIISQSQRDFIGNNESINDVWGKPPQANENVGDHVPLTTAQPDERGGHKKTTLIEQAADPATLVNEIALYSKEDSSNTELYYRRENSGGVNKLTSRGALSVGGLVLRAYVFFDYEGKIVEVDRVDEEGVVSKVPMSFNITSVVPNQPLVNGRNVRSDWNITFTGALPTADYFWIVQSFNVGDNGVSSSPSPVIIQPRNNATYGNTVTTTSFAVRGMPMSSSTLGSNFNVSRVLFQAYTVA